AGKTTLLQKVCNATGKPEIFDGKGNEVDPTSHATSALINDDQINADVVKPSICPGARGSECTARGTALGRPSMYAHTHYRNVLDKLLTPTSVATTTLNELVFRSNPGFVFHGSC
ncbi:hypothetical protein M405DRAFT_741566, partial [Rhizopogon salebrosus TDB-379]